MEKQPPNVLQIKAMIKGLKAVSLKRVQKHLEYNTVSLA